MLSAGQPSKKWLCFSQPWRGTQKKKSPGEPAHNKQARQGLYVLYDPHIGIRQMETYNVVYRVMIHSELSDSAGNSGGWSVVA